MSNILEVLGKGLEPSLMSLLLPRCRKLSVDEVSHYQQQLHERPEDLAFAFVLGVHYASAGATDKAEELFDQILITDSRHLDTYLAWASLCSTTGYLDESIIKLQDAYDIFPDDPRILFGLGYCYERLGELKVAIDYYEKAASKRMIHAMHRLGAISMYNQDFKALQAQYEKLRSENPGVVWNYIILGQTQLENGKFSDAIDTFERALTIEPDNYELRDDYIESLIEEEQYEDAICELKKVIEKQGEFPDTYVRVGDLYCRLNNDEQAINYYHKALEVHPGYLEGLVKIGTQHLRKKRYLESAHFLGKAVEINDEMITSYVGLGIAQHYAGYIDMGRETLELAAALEPNTNLLFSEVVRIQLKLSEAQSNNGYDFETPYNPYGAGDTASSEDLVAKQIQRHHEEVIKNPAQADLRYRYGLLLRSTGDSEKAIEHFTKALELNPSFQKCRIKLGIALQITGKVKQGLEHLKTAMKINHEYINVHYKLGLMYCDKIQFALAVEHFQMEDVKGSDENVKDNLSLALQNMGLVDRALATWKAVCELDPESTLAFHAARDLVKLDHV